MMNKKQLNHLEKRLLEERAREDVFRLKRLKAKKRRPGGGSPGA